MAQQKDGPTAEEKGKGKAVNNDTKNGEKSQDETKKGKDGKPVDGKKDGEVELPEGTKRSAEKARYTLTI